VFAEGDLPVVSDDDRDELVHAPRERERREMFIEADKVKPDALLKIDQGTFDIGDEIKAGVILRIRRPEADVRGEGGPDDVVGIARKRGRCAETHVSPLMKDIRVVPRPWCGTGRVGAGAAGILSERHRRHRQEQHDQEHLFHRERLSQRDLYTGCAHHSGS